MKDSLKTAIRKLYEHTECLEALEFIRDNTELVSDTEVIVQLQTEIDRRNEQDPTRDMIQHHLRLLKVLRDIHLKLTPKKAVVSSHESASHSS